MEWNLPTIGIVTAIFFIGYIIGLVEAAIKQKIKDKKKAAAVEKEANELLKPPLAEVKTPNLFSINRDPTNALVMEVEGQAYANKEDLSTDNKRKVVNLLVELRPWLETDATSPTSPPEKTGPEPIKARPLAAQPVHPQVPHTPSLAKKSPPTRPVGSIVSQIDEVLQTRLATSSLANQGIRLVESPSGGVLVYIGLNKYDGIEAIPDPEIQTFIRQSVEEWEKLS